MAVCNRISELGSTAEAVGRAADLSGNTVRAMIAGEHWPNRATRVRLALALGWAPGALLDEDEAEAPPVRTGLEDYSDHDLLMEQLRRLHERARRAGG